eukprot:CAMPEP_0117746366 /NCGR_PEP_ID=MMETSP0947-20121206/7904_1 /TAXON_ID=44440 /ORGANISM="Chattonella subsalsa, Strain CCMP2191" /LENGTH=988 /DNA_ID=CAMNT_0005563677 /DNA_START=25 /DNA_END=2991 /DNA_ORIENTATION=+
MEAFHTSSADRRNKFSICILALLLHSGNTFNAVSEFQRPANKRLEVTPSPNGQKFQQPYQHKRLSKLWVSGEGRTNQDGNFDDDLDEDDFDSSQLLSELQSLISQASEKDEQSSVDDATVMEGLEALVNGPEEIDSFEEDMFTRMLESLPDDGLSGGDVTAEASPKSSTQDKSNGKFEDDFLNDLSRELGDFSGEISTAPDNDFLSALSSLINKDLNDPIAPTGLRDPPQKQKPPRRRQREKLPDLDIPRYQKRTRAPMDPLFKYSKQIVDCKQTKDWEKAVKILQNTINQELTPSTRMFTEVINQCYRNRQAQKAIDVYKMAKSCDVTADSYFYSAVVSAASYVMKGDSIWELSMDMRETQGVEMDEHCFTALIIAMGRINDEELLVKAISQLEQDNLPMTLRLYSSIVTAFLQVGNKDTGMMYFEKLKEEGFSLDERIYSSSIKALSISGHYDTAFEMYQEMIQNDLVPSYQCYKNIFRTCDASGEWQMALDILKDIENTGGDTSSYIEQVVGLLVRAGQNEKASELLENTDKDKGVVANTRMYSALMAEHSKNKNYAATMQVKNDMEKIGLRLDKSGYNAIISVCKATNKPGEAMKYFNQMRKERVQPDGYTYNNILGIHSQNSDGEKALKLLDEMEDNGISDTVSYNLVIRACAKQKNADPDQPLNLYRRMKKRSIEPNLFVYNSLISSSAQSGNWQMAQYFLGEMKLKGIGPDVFSYSSAITAASNAEESAAAMELFDEMEENGTMPDEIILYQMVRCVSLAGDLEDAQQFLKRLEALPEANAYSIAMGYRYTAIAALICNDPDLAMDLWQEASEIRYTEPEDYSFAFKACAKHGFWEFASDLMAEARADGIDCGKLFYEQVILACSKGGAPEIALDWLEEMLAENHIPVPSIMTEITAACISLGDWETATSLVDKMHKLENIEVEDQCYSNTILSYAQAKVFTPCVRTIKFIEANDITLSLEAYNSLLQMLLPPKSVSVPSS